METIVPVIAIVGLLIAAICRIIEIDKEDRKRAKLTAKSWIRRNK